MYCYGAGYTPFLRTSGEPLVYARGNDGTPCYAVAPGRNQSVLRLSPGRKSPANLFPVMFTGKSSFSFINLDTRETVMRTEGMCALRSLLARLVSAPRCIQPCGGSHRSIAPGVRPVTATRLLGKETRATPSSVRMRTLLYRAERQPHFHSRQTVLCTEGGTILHTDHFAREADGDYLVPALRRDAAQ